MWVKLDDRRAINHKLLTAGIAASGLDVIAMCWSSLHQNDGFISTDDLQLIATMYHCDDWEPLARRLVEVGRWTREGRKKGYRIRDFLDYNPSKADMEERRKKDRERKRQQFRGDVDSAGNPRGRTTEA